MPDHLYHQTPLFKSHLLKADLRLDVHYKMECYQPTNSFKIRGMEHLCRHHMSAGKQKFIASSGGNAGYSLAYVGEMLGASVTVVVPESTSEFMIGKIKSLGTPVIIYGAAWDEAHEYALHLADEQNAIYVSPFDDPLLWEGHASLIDECKEQMDQPDVIIVAVGGGGLLCGVFEGLKRNNWESTRIITTETFGAASFHKSFLAQELITLDSIDTIATSLGAKTVSENALKQSAEFDVTTHTIIDQEALNACHNFLDEYSVLVEPACGAALSIPYFYSHMIENAKALVIACGGANTPKEKLL